MEESMIMKGKIDVKKSWWIIAGIIYVPIAAFTPPPAGPLMLLFGIIAGVIIGYFQLYKKDNKRSNDYMSMSDTEFEQWKHDWRQNLIEEKKRKYTERINENKEIHEDIDIGTHYIRFFHAVKCIKCVNGMGTVELQADNNTTFIELKCQYCTNEPVSCINTLALEGYLDYPGIRIVGDYQNEIVYRIPSIPFEGWKFDPNNVVRELNAALPGARITLCEKQQDMVRVSFST